MFVGKSVEPKVRFKKQKAENQSISRNFRVEINKFFAQLISKEEVGKTCENTNVIILGL